MAQATRSQRWQQFPCWLWDGAVTRLGGYGRVRVGNRTRMVHVVAYEAWYGPVPDGLQLDHLCRERRCYNPDHLEPVDAKENKRRSMEARGAWAGHGSHMEYRRGCRCDECMATIREYHRAYAQKVKAKRLEMGAEWTHGTVLSYNQGGCRCDECRQANAAKSRAYRAKRRSTR